MRFRRAWSIPAVLALAASAISQTTGEKKVNPKDGQAYIWIPAGTFRMGCLGPASQTSSGEGADECLGNELPRHSVRLSKGFWIGATLVTQEPYMRIMGVRDSKFEGDHLPVDRASWDAAKIFCARVGMRLPTEAEWEYASRGGTAAERYGRLNEIAWYRGNSAGRARPVGEKQPNPYGLYDMLGNVWEWVDDWYAPYARAGDGACCDNPAPAVENPQGPAEGRYRVLRGGSWNDFSADVRMSLRDHLKSPADEESDRDYDTYSTGFRCAASELEN